MSYETIAESVATLSETEKLNLMTVIVNSMKSKTDAASETAELAFPRIHKNRPISQATLDMVIGDLPKGFDVDKAHDEMWEEFAR